MKAMTVAANQFPAWAEGRLPEPPFPEQTPCIRNNHEWSVTPNRFLDGSEHKSVTKRNDRDQHCHTDDAAQTSFPYEHNPERQEGRVEELVAANPRHQSVTETIRQVQVYEPE